nr:unnamed protein product [Callosobruchus analis]
MATLRNTKFGWIITVKLPLKHSPNLLGDSKANAVKVFYFDFIHEYEDLGQMKKTSVDSGVITYVLQHHGIMKETVTTKLRTVFDGSCQS